MRPGRHTRLSGCILTYWDTCALPLATVPRIAGKVSPVRGKPGERCEPEGVFLHAYNATAVTDIGGKVIVKPPSTSRAPSKLTGWIA